VIEAPDLDRACPPATDGDIAVINLQSARRRSWSRFWEDPHRPGVAEALVEQEQLAAQFLGDLGAFERLETLAMQVARRDGASIRAALIQAQVAATTHRFADARWHLAQAEVCGAPAVAMYRLRLSVDQACGVRLDVVLEARRRMAATSGRLGDLVPLGALLADLREFDEAERIYGRALRQYQDVSPFALAWVCFQMGVLWGELGAEPESSRAAAWYRQAIAYLPCYVKARVHLAEIYSSGGRAGDAEALLGPAVSSGDPEVCWRLADVMAARGGFADAEAHLQAARSGFERLIEKHLLAFADHAAEFYAGSGKDCRRALDLARVNIANRPTLRAFEQAYAIAVGTNDTSAASEILAAARERWGTLAAWRWRRGALSQS
jgi:tetratricopeptide (TPR) repeat protein